MLKKVLALGAISVALAGAAPSVWSGKDGSSQISFGGGGGYWYSFADAGAEVSPSSALMNSAIKSNEYLPASYIVGEGADLSATVGFDWYNNGADSTKTPVDVSAASGLCVTYSSTKPINVLLKQHGISTDCPSYVTVLPASEDITAYDLSWAGFSPEGAWECESGIYSLDVSAQDAVHFQYKTEGTANLLIYQVGLAGECSTLADPEPESSSSAVVASSSAAESSSSAIEVSSSAAESSSSVAEVSSSSVTPPTGLPLIWEGTSHSPTVTYQTSGGYWYTYADAKSTVSGINVASNWLNVNFKVAAGGSSYAAVGFDWYDNGDESLKTYVNIANTPGLCVEYQVDAPINIVLKQNDIGDGCPAFVAVLPVKENVGIVDVTWAAFAKEGTWGGAACDYTLNLAKQDAVHFQQKTVGTSNIKIHKVGFVGDCGVADVTLGSTKASSSSIASQPSSSSANTLPGSSAVVGSSSSAIPTTPLVWDGAAKLPTITINGSTGGYWYSYADISSKVVPTGTNFASHIKTNSAVNASFTMGSSTNKYAAVGFDWFDNGKSTKTAVDLSAETGLCLTYSSNAVINVVLKQNGVNDECPNYIFKLPASTATTNANIAWTSFAKEGNWGTNCNYDLNIAQQDAVHFQYKAAGNANIKITKVGFTDACGAVNAPVSSAAQVSSSATTVVTSSSSAQPIAISSSSTKPIPGTSSSAGIIIPVSSSSAGSDLAALCEQPIVAGSVVPWKLMDDNQDGILNYADPNHVCYADPSPVWGAVAQVGFGFVGINNRVISFRTYESGEVNIKAYSLSGKQLSHIYRGPATAGVNHIAWNSANLEGVVIFRITQNGKGRVLKAVLTQK